MNLVKPFTCNFFLLLLTISSLSAANPGKSFSKIITDKNPLKVLTPSLNNISTKKLILSNDIKVLLISDSLARKSAAALAVGAGSWHDAPEFPGIAHFCEHMLFMGSKKYPDENMFFQHVQDNGGMLNAYTKPDRTVYMYSINHDKLNSSLDIFSRFFIDPLFRENCIGRELLAVNQEHNKNIENDAWRAWFIFKQEGNQNHPNAKFSTGTEETLKIVKRSDLEKWYREHYKSEEMYLVVYSNQDLDSLQVLVESSFCEVEASQNGVPSIAYSKLTSPGQEGHINYIEPVKDIKQLSISWEIPPAYANDMDKKTYLLIAYALSHHMKGGLYSHLKKEGLVENLYSECDRISKDHVVLNITMDLTAEGIQKTDHILYTFHQALNKLKHGNIPSHIYNDMESVISTSYKWQSRQNPFYFVKECADTMVDEDLETFPYKTLMITEFDPKASRDLLSFLTPQNAIYTVIGSQVDTHRDSNKTETWMNSKYSTVKINEDLLSSWETAKPHKDIILPNPNPYISNQQKLLIEEVSEKMHDPMLIADEEFGKCYYWKDNHFLVPKTEIIVRIKSPEINDSAKSLCLNNLFVAYLNYHMSSLISEGRFADISTNIYSDELGLNLSVNGYHDKIGSYMMSFLSNLTASYPTAQEFSLLKEKLLSSCKSSKKTLPYVQGMNMLGSLISNVKLNSQQEELALRSITLEQFQKFQKSILNENYLNVFISGNINRENALLHYSEIKNTLSSNQYNPQNHFVPRYTPFYTDVAFPKKVSMQTEMGGNSTVLLIDQGKFTYEKYASQHIFSTILKEAFFSELRSKQQTGYLVHAKGLNSNGRLLQYFIVQSTTHYPEELLARYELFLEEYNRSMSVNINKERFNAIRDSIIVNLEIPIENLHAYSHNQFELAFTYGGEFDRKKKIISALKSLEYDTFISDSKNFISRDNTKRLAVLVEGSKMDSKSFSYTETSLKELAALKKYTTKDSL